MVEYGLLARGEDHRLAGEAAAIRSLLAGAWNWTRMPLRGRCPGGRPGISQPAPSAASG